MLSLSRRFFSLNKLSSIEQMTNNLTVVVGAVLTTALIPGAEDIAQVTLTLTGGGLLTWIAIMQSRELNKLRTANRELNRELGKKCKNCTLAQKANSMLTDAGNEYMEHELEIRRNADL